MPELNALPDGGSLQANDLLFIDRGGTSRKALLANVPGSAVDAWAADAGTGQVATSVAALAALDAIPATQFGAVAQARTASTPTNYTTALQKAFDAAAAAGRAVYLPPGAWFHTGLTLATGQVVVGAGRQISGFKMIAGTAQHSLRASANTVKNVVLQGFYIDGSRGAYSAGLQPNDLSGHAWGDGIYANLASDASLFVSDFDTNQLWAGPRWAVRDVLIYQPMRHGLYTAGIGLHELINVRVLDSYVDGMNLNHTGGLLSHAVVQAAGRNGFSLGAAGLVASNLRAEFCGTNTAKADGQTTAISDIWLLATAGAGEIGPGGACAVILRAGGKSTQLVNVRCADTLGPGLILLNAVDCKLRLNSFNNVGSLRLQHSLGATASVPSAVVQIRGATIGNIVQADQSDSYATLLYATTNLLQVYGNTSVDNPVTIVYDKVQTYATPKLFSGETEAAWTGRGNSIALTSLQRR